MSDDCTGIESLIAEVQAAGHKRIDVVQVSDAESMTQGYRSERLLRGLHEAGCDAVAVPIAAGRDAPNEAALRKVVGDITVLMCANDPVMIGAWETLAA
ncbi:hypothetical protein [Candidatus Poriferisocius sp.]|uniref:hypothetical protein n=1 Tax=Candidatus Poriferisocius sp. TaxID=3101276 RepID=UPI003B011B0A